MSHDWSCVLATVDCVWKIRLFVIHKKNKFVPICDTVIMYQWEKWQGRGIEAMDDKVDGWLVSWPIWIKYLKRKQIKSVTRPNGNDILRKFPTGRRTRIVVILFTKRRRGTVNTIRFISMNGRKKVNILVVNGVVFSCWIVCPGLFHVLARSANHDLEPHMVNTSHKVNTLSIGHPLMHRLGGRYPTGGTI